MISPSTPGHDVLTSTLRSYWAQCICNIRPNTFVLFVFYDQGANQCSLDYKMTTIAQIQIEFIFIHI